MARKHVPLLTGQRRVSHAETKQSQELGSVTWLCTYLRPC